MTRHARLKIDILTIFPNIFNRVFKESLIGKAHAKSIIDIRIIDIRKFTHDKHRSVDDRPFGGGPGMVLKVEPVFKALTPYRTKKGAQKPEIILLSPQGKPFEQADAKKLVRKKHLVLICGHYEGFDERIRQYIDREISIGDVVLTGGEFPAMVVVDAVSRLIPGVVKERQSIENDSFFNGRLDHPHFTRPDTFLGLKVPDVLLSGHHKNIGLWRKMMSLKNTLAKRPDLLIRYKPNKQEKEILKQIKK